MISVFIGAMGAGKSSHAVKLARKALKKGKLVYSNFPIKGCYLYDVHDDLGKFDIRDCFLILDEAGIDMNNRAYKSLDKCVIKWLKLARHYNVDMAVYSQAFDFDITIRRLSSKMYIVKNLFFGFSTLRPLVQFWDVDADGQPILKWRIRNIFSLFYRPRFYKYYDSFSSPQLPHKEFTLIPE